MNACVTMFIDTGKVLDTEALLIVLDTEVGVASRVNNIPILTRKVRSTAYGKQIIPTVLNLYEVLGITPGKYTVP